MRQCGALTLVLGFLVAADDPNKGKERPNTDKEKIYGTWLAVGFEEDGNVLKEDQLKEGAKAMKWVLHEGALVMKPGKGDDVRCTLKLDPSKNPKTMDVVVANGPRKGMTFLAIYSLEKNTLKVCMGEKERPKEFKTGTGAGKAIIIFKREKP